MNGFVQPYDVVMLVVLASCTLFGVWKGMAWQVASFSSLVLSAGAAFHFSGPLAPYVSSQTPWNRCLATLLLYLVTSLVVWLAFRMVSSFLDRVKLREFDRQIGGVVGFAKGVLFCLVITFFCVTLSEPARQAILKTRSGYCMARLIQRANLVIPQEVRGVVGGYLEELDRKLDPTGG